MKKTLSSLIVLTCLLTVTTFAQIPNPGFESWTAGDPDGWATSNVFEISLIPVTQTTDKHSGLYALRGEVVNFMGVPMGPVIQSGPGGTGFAISEQYHSFELYYKFTPVGGDKFSVNVALEKAGTPIAQGAVALPATVDVYTHITVPLSYTTSDVPDAAIIQISITGPVTGPDVHVGSVMFVDDLVFSLGTGVENLSGTGVTGNCYPNPASEFINIPLTGIVSGALTLKVFDPNGKQVKSVEGDVQQYTNNVFRFSVTDLSPGLYFYSVNGQNGRCQGKFILSR